MLKLAWKYMRYYKSQTFAIFASIVLTAALLAGIGSLMYSSRRSDIENSKTVYGDWHYRAAVDAKTYRMVGNGKADDGESDRRASGSGGSDRGYVLEQCGKMEIRDAVDEPYLIWFVHADESYLQMVHRDFLEGTYPQAENEIAADLYTLSNLGGTGTVGESITVDGKSYTVTGILAGEWAANANEMELFVGDSFTGRGSQTFLYLRFAEDKPLYRQMDAFQRKYRISSEMTETNAEVTQYLGGEPPESIVDIVKFGLTEEQGNFTYIILKLESEYHLSYYGMTLLLCLFSLFVVYSVFNISASKRTAEYGMMQTLGISEKRIGFTLVLELWMLFAAGYPLGCLLGNGVLGFFVPQPGGSVCRYSLCRKHRYFCGQRGDFHIRRRISSRQRALVSRSDAGAGRRTGKILHCMGCNGHWPGHPLCVPCPDRFSDCIFPEKTLPQRCDERGYFIYKTQEDLREKPCRYGRRPCAEVHVLE